MLGSVTAVIMAGGRGTRFWPVSTGRMPKQFLNLSGSGTMLQETAARFQGICEPEDVMVVTGKAHAQTVKEQLPAIPEANLLLEPVGRNTAPCIGWASRTLIDRGQGDRIMVVVPSDHIIDSTEGFRSTVQSALQAARTGRLVTIGIPPDRPATGYGYLKMGAEIADGVFRVESFREKPDLRTAEEYLGSGEYLWNAGMFIWTAESIWEHISALMPELSEGLLALDPGTAPAIENYSALPSQSIDYGVMEKADDVAAVPARFEWTDIGDWPSAGRCGIGRGEVISRNSDNVTVWNEGKLTVLLGVSNISVVETDRVTLIMADDSSQEVKEIVAELEDDRPDLV